jgi:hypothetical protein
MGSARENLRDFFAKINNLSRPAQSWKSLLRAKYGPEVQRASDETLWSWHNSSIELARRLVLVAFLARLN